jgi:chemotaxis protein CheC
MVISLTPWQKDALTEIVNIGVGRGAATLNTMCKSYVRLSVPTIDIIDAAELADRLKGFESETISTVTMPFNGQITGLASILFPPDSASNLVTALTGEDPIFSGMDSIRTATLNEVGNIIINGVMGAVVNMLSMSVTYSTPQYLEDSVKAVLSVFHMGETVIMAKARFQIEEFSVEGDILLLFEVGSFSTLINGVEASMRHGG